MVIKTGLKPAKPGVTKLLINSTVILIHLVIGCILLMIGLVFPLILVTGCHFEGEDGANYEWNVACDWVYEDEQDHQDDIHNNSFKLTDSEPGRVPIEYRDTMLTPIEI